MRNIEKRPGKKTSTVTRVFFLRNSISLLGTLLFVFANFSVASAQSIKPVAELPQWVVDDWGRRTSQSATWVAENPNENVPYDAYALHWAYGPGKTTLKGRLYAIKDGEDV